MRLIQKSKILMVLAAVIALLVAVTVNQEDNKFSEMKTGLFLDTLENEVLLVFENDMPVHYISRIFTPVCETGECKPVYINIYWDLMGNFSRFDFPKEEILTKLDHIPFTAGDYVLLNEILRGADPRYSQRKHSSPSPALSQSRHDPDGPDHSSPAPAAAVMLTKMQMVDAISGATLAPQQDKFVPGALYTTYTLWGLANDHRHLMEKYTRSNYFQPKFFQQFLNNTGCKCRKEFIKSMALKEEHGYSNTLMSIMDTASLELATYCNAAIDYWDIGLDTVQNTLGRSFSRIGNDDFKLLVVQRWQNSMTSSSNVLLAVKSLNENPALFNAIMQILYSNEFCSEEVVTVLIDKINSLKSEQNGKLIFNYLYEQKDLLSESNWDLIKNVKRKNGW
jgi:hypothetical protein